MNPQHCVEDFLLLEPGSPFCGPFKFLVRKFLICLLSTKNYFSAHDRLGGELLEHARLHVSGGQQHAWLSCPRPACSFRLTVGRSLLRFTVLALQHVHAHHQEEEGQQAHPPTPPTINPHHEWKLGTVETSLSKIAIYRRSLQSSKENIHYQKI
jgi:hypothetical protein